MAVVKKVVTKKVIKKVDDKKPVVDKTANSKPIQLKEVKVVAPRDSVNVGYAGKYTKMDTRDLKNMVKNNNLKSIDTTSTQAMSKTSYGSLDKKAMADTFLAKKKRGGK